jgi:glycosyltransferase involved in cell wall biosynthesis
VQAVATVVFLARQRPSAIIATNPPVWLGLIAYAYSKLRHSPMVLDSHPGGFGAQDDHVAARLQPIHRWLVRRVAAVLVTGEPWSTRVRQWGGRPIAMWEAPVLWTVPPMAPRAEGEPLRVLYVGVFANDEPVELFVDAMNQVEGIEVSITGDRRRAPEGLYEKAAQHVRFVGYLRGTQYVAAIANTDVIVTLTTEPSSVMRAACEAIWAERPVLVTDTPATRDAFPSAVHVANDVSALAAAVAALRDDLSTATVDLAGAREAQEQAWQRQVAALRTALRGN